MRDAGKFLNSLLFVAVAVATLLFSLAASAGGRIVVFHAEGEGADAIAKDLKEQLPKGLSAGDVDSFHSALGKQGHKGPMGKALDGPKSPGRSCSIRCARPPRPRASTRWSSSA